MDFSFSEEQLAMKDSLERMFNDTCSDDEIKTLAQSGEPIHRALWSHLAEAGIFATPFAEEDGGLGLSLVEFCLAIELQGRFLPQMPLVSSIVESALPISQGSNEDIKKEVLKKVIDGSHILCAARKYRGVQQAKQLACVSKGADDWALQGRTGFAYYASLADGIVLEVVDDSAEVLLVYLDANKEGVACVQQTAISGEPAGYFEFSDVSFSSASVIARGARAQELVAEQRHTTWVALAALQTGILDEGLKRAAAYVSERKQFGRTLGSFQAVSQQAADAYMEVESLRSVYWRSLEDIQEGEDLSVSAAVAKYWVAQAGHKVAHASLHLHGGIGQDLEYPIHRYFLWAKQAERYLGSADVIARELGNTLLESSNSKLAELCL